MFMSKLSSQVISDLDAVIAETPKGKLRGIRKEGTYIFRGIKYADAARFRMPEPVQPWEGVKDAMSYGCICPNITTEIAPDQTVEPHAYGPQDENCQYLNVWTQSLNPQAKAPVVFWIHGGSGSSVEQYSYDGEELSRFGNVVFVSSNHRMNLLGCLDLSAYGGEYSHSGSLSLADLTAALQWVRENIAAFGGDPDNVTIEGQSFGGFKTVALLQSPTADGLYSKVIVSGDPIKYAQEKNGWTPRVLNRLLADEMVKEAGSLKTLETMSYEELADIYLAANEKVKAQTGGLGGVVNLIPEGEGGDFYVGHPNDIGFRRETLQIPMLIGTSFGEHHSNEHIAYDDNRKFEWSEEKTKQLLLQVFGEDTDEIISEYRKLYPDRILADALFTDRVSRINCRDIVRKRLQAGCAPVYNWVFDFDSPFLGGIVAWHCSEIHFHFHNAQYNEASYVPGVTEELQDKMAEAWCAFMRAGNPSTEKLPAWEPVTEDCFHTMYFAKECRVTHGDDDRLLELFGAHREYPPATVDFKHVR